MGDYTGWHANTQPRDVQPWGCDTKTGAREVETNEAW